MIVRLVKATDEGNIIGADFIEILSIYPAWLSGEKGKSKRIETHALCRTESGLCVFDMSGDDGIEHAILEGICEEEKPKQRKTAIKK